jgi:segregation and condensation protein A
MTDYKVKLEVFEGPLDLLLYLVKKNEFNIHDIPVNEITEQYLEYLNLMQLLNLDIAGDYLVMASTLVHIKSKMLLPHQEAENLEEEADPREDLVRRLLEYKKYKEAAGRLHQFENQRSQWFTRFPAEVELEGDDSPFIEASLFDLITAFSGILKNMPKEVLYEVDKDDYTIAEKVHQIFHVLVERKKILFSEMFDKASNKIEAITIFLAILELIRLKEIVFFQNKVFGDFEILRNSESISPPKMSEQKEGGAT